MKPTFSMCARLAVVLAAPAWLLAAPAAAQHQPHEAAQPAPQAAPAPSPEPPAQAVPRDSNDAGGASRGKPAGRSDSSSTESGTTTRGGETTSARGRDGKPATGGAVPRTSPPPSTGGRGTTIIPAYGGYGYGGYGYGGYGYGGYDGGYYDPYDPERSYPDPAQYQRYEEGALRLKLKPRDATVFIDGYYTGIVDDFDGLFQRVRIEAGPHRIEVRAPGLESLEFNVFIEPDRTLTLRGELKKIQ